MAPRAQRGGHLRICCSRSNRLLLHDLAEVRKPIGIRFGIYGDNPRYRRFFESFWGIFGGREVDLLRADTLCRAARGNCADIGRTRTRYGGESTLFNVSCWLADARYDPEPDGKHRQSPLWQPYLGAAPRLRPQSSPRCKLSAKRAAAKYSVIART